LDAYKHVPCLKKKNQVWTGFPDKTDDHNNSSTDGINRPAHSFEYNSNLSMDIYAGICIKDILLSNV